MWIKICGITRQQDADAVVECGADAIGLNFYAASPRSVDQSVGRDIADRIREDVDIVGVFVNLAIPDVVEVSQNVGLTAVQFHGDELPEDLIQFRRACPGVGIIRALRMSNRGDSLVSIAEPWMQLEPPPTGLLVDAFVPGEYGGTGKTVNPGLLRDHRSTTSRLILAGGLTPENVSEVAEDVVPWGVDTASGVEDEPGIKSRQLIRRFIQRCRQVDTAVERTRLPKG